MRYATLLVSALFASPLVIAACSSTPSASTNPSPNKADKGDDSKNGSPSNNPSSNTGTGSPASGDAGSAGSDGDTDFILFDEEMYTGFDGNHPYQLAGVALLLKKTGEKVDGGGEKYANIAFESPPEITVSDPKIGELKTIPRPEGAMPEFAPHGQWFTVDIKGPGQANVEAKYKSRVAKAIVKVAQYTAAQWDLGKARYTAPADPGPTRKACVSCHAGRDEDVAPTHGAFFQSYLSDEALLSGIKTGDLDGYKLEVEGGHKWALTADEEKGILAFLRSLKPFGGQ